jgi:peptidoglycan/LPS O-acetylase OafA/YrhL
LNPSAARPSFYKPELDTLRFFAFLSVFVAHNLAYPIDLLVQHHVPPWAAKIGISFVHAGVYGVDVFFALSAYLITELLLREKAVMGSLNVRAFYLRRILRIWPLYYLFVPLAALIPFLNPYHQFTWRYVLPFLLLMGNWSFVAFGWPTTAAMPLWSVSVEEQFYLLWPPIVARISRRQITIAAVTMVAAANICRLLGVAAHESSAQLWGNTIAHLDAIAAGILLAVVPLGQVLSSRYGGRIALMLGGACCLAARGHFVAIDATEQLSVLGTLIGYPVVMLACTAILVAFIGVPFRSRTLQYLGKISYGLYVYHLMSMSIAYKLMPFDRGVLHAGLRIVAALGITIAIAAVSYMVVEKPFLNLKRRFTYVDSRPV